MARVFPTHATCWRITHLLRDADPSGRALRASSRLLELAPGLPHGSHLTLVLAGDGDKRVSIELHADTDAKVTQADIDHVAEGCAVVTSIVNRPVPLPALGELVTLFEVVGASTQPTNTYPEFEFAPEPRYPTPTNFGCAPIRGTGRSGSPTTAWTWVKALAGCEAQVRVHIAPSNEFEQEYIAANIRRSVQLGGVVDHEDLPGTPVRIRCFVGASEPRLPPRLRAAILGLGVGLRLKQQPLDGEMIATWDGLKRPRWPARCNRSGWRVVWCRCRLTARTRASAASGRARPKPGPCRWWTRICRWRASVWGRPSMSSASRSRSVWVPTTCCCTPRCWVPPAPASRACWPGWCRTPRRPAMA